MFNSLITLSVLALAITALILVLTYSREEVHKEGYTMAPEGVTVTPQGALTGPVVYTNHVTKLQPSELLNQASAGKLNDQSLLVLGAKNNSEQLDKALGRQLKIHEIQDKSNNGFQTVEDLKEISKNIAQDANSIHGLFTRDGTASTKLFIDKYATVGVINDKYMPNRDRPKTLRAVGTVIVMPGFDFDATKALDSNGTGICPTGGVPRAGLERHKKKAPVVLNSLNNVNKSVVKQNDATDLLESNNILSATAVTDLNTADQAQAISPEEAQRSVNKANEPTLQVDDDDLAALQEEQPLQPEYIVEEPPEDQPSEQLSESFRRRGW